MQYPNFLYPGKEQKDFSDSKFATENTFYLINTLNPFSWIKTVARLKKYAPDLVVLQWWNPYFALCFGSIALSVKVLCKSKILFICHNVLPHEKLPFQAALTKMTLSRGDSAIVHSIDDQEQLLKLIPRMRCKRCVHPTYNIFKNEELSKEQSKTLLKVSGKKVLLFFGFVREYKGLIYLIDALPQVINCCPDIKLLVVGEFFQDKSLFEREISRLKLEQYVEIYDEYIPDREVGKFFAAADIVVLPYTTATQSGIVQIAYGFDRPVIVTNVGGLPEVVINSHTGYVVEPSDASELANAIIKFYIDGKEKVFIDNIKKQQDRYSWERLTEAIEELCGL